jgi:membrane protein implicated in regulation of membrane protease activity
MTGAGQDRSPLWIWCGAIAAPLCWFAQQLLAASLVPLDCRGRQWLVPAVCAMGATLLVVAMAVSWRALQRVSQPGGKERFSQRRARFVGIVGSVMPLMFLFAIIWQGIAGVIYSGCER